MYFSHSPRIWEEFPQLIPGLMVVDNITPEGDVEGTIQSLFEVARKRLESSAESQMPQVAAWRRAYSQMGLKPTKYRSAAEALLRRFRKENQLPKLHPLVDLCNAFSLANALPVAIFDLDHIDSFIEVRHALGTEEYHAFSGKVENPAVDEVVFADAANQLHARRWTFRQSRPSTVSDSTSKVLIISEGLHESASEDIAQLLEKLSVHVTNIWSAPKKHKFLTADQPKLEFDI